jgi:CTP-dependent riboflavin kinase
MSGITKIAMTTADASGNYSFSGLGSGTYTISVAGYDASNNHYVGSISVPFTGNMSNVTIQAFPG